MELGYAVAGFVVGAVVGMTGVGGGSLMTPILVLGFGIQPALAVGTDLLYASITKCGGIFVHHRNRTIDWRIVGLLSCGSLPASTATLALLRQLGMRGVAYDQLITVTLGVALILTALALTLRPRILAIAQAEKLEMVRAFHRRWRPLATVASGVVLGVLVTLSSVGAGALGAAILFFMYPWARPVRIVGTDIAHAVPLTALAGLGHAQLGTVDYVLLASLLAGSLPGIYLGSHFGARLPDRIVRPAMAVMLFVIGVKMAMPAVA